MIKLWIVLSGILLLNVTLTPMGRAGQSVPAGAPAERLRREIRIILQDSRFEYTDYWSGVQKFFNRLSQLFKKKQPLPQSSKMEDRLLGGVGLIAFSVMTLVLIVYLAKFFRREHFLGAGTSQPEDMESVPPELRSLAQRCAATANYREAIRYLYRAALDHLTTRGWIPDGVALSDGEYLRMLLQRLGKEHPRYLAFRRLMGRFQAGWYGFKNCNAVDYQEATADLETLLRGAG